MHLTRYKSIQRMKGGLIVSVQADPGTPLDRPDMIAAMAESVDVPGCVGLRINGPKNISAVRAVSTLPIIGIYKTYDENGRVRITPTFEMAQELVHAGADIVAIDGSHHVQQAEETLSQRIQRIHVELCCPVMADISNFEEGIEAASAGADIVATTLSGYTNPPFASPFDPPDLDLVQRLSQKLFVPVICEGRINTPDLARKALEAGAYAIVVGSAITRPQHIVQMFLNAIGR